MKTFLIYIFAFICTVFIHALYCRRQQSHQLYARSYLIIAAVVGVIAISLINVLHLDEFSLSGLLLYILCIPSYLVVYVTTQLESPSRKILETLTERPCTKSDIVLSLKQAQFIQSRLQQMCDAGLVNKVQSTYQLTQSGQQLALFYVCYQKILGRELGG